MGCATGVEILSFFACDASHPGRYSSWLCFNRSLTLCVRDLCRLGGAIFLGLGELSTVFAFRGNKPPVPVSSGPAVWRPAGGAGGNADRSEEHTSELQSLRQL